MRFTCILIILTILITGASCSYAANDIYEGANTLNFTVNQTVLDNLSGQHPRLFLESGGIAGFIANAKQDQWVDRYKFENWQSITYMRNYCLTGVTIPSYVDPNVTSGSANQVFWKIWDIFPYLALIYKNDIAANPNNRECLDRIISICNSLASYGKWESTPDLATGHTLMSLAIVYDWLYNDFSPTERTVIRNLMLEKAREVREIMLKPTKQNWNRAWLQNHMWIAVSGLSCVAAVLYDEVPETRGWIQETVNHISTTISTLPEDGFNHEGISYWYYGMESLLLFVDMAEKSFGINMLTGWFNKNAEYLVYAFLPKEQWAAGNLYSAFADCNKSSLPYSHSMWFLAKKTRNKQLQWLTNELYNQSFTTKGRRWLDILYYDPTLEKISPKAAGMPLFKHFDDTDYVFSKSDWEDNEASMLTFRSGAVLGKAQILKQTSSVFSDWGSGHVHPDNNSFSLFGGGELLIRDDDYGLPKSTRQHSTLTINDIGQAGEGTDWFTYQHQFNTKKSAKILKAEAYGDIDYIVGDAADSYDKAATGLRKFNRHMIFIKPDVIIYVDDIETETEKQLKTRLWPSSQNIVKDTSNNITAFGENVNLKITPLMDDNADISINNEMIYNQTTQFPAKSISFTKNASSWTNAVALSWDGGEKTIGFARLGNVMQFQVGEKTLTLNRSTNKLSVVLDRIDLSTKYENNIVTFSGIARPDENITLKVVKSGEAEENMTADNIMEKIPFLTQIKSGSDGSFEVKFTLDSWSDMADYEVYIYLNGLIAPMKLPSFKYLNDNSENFLTNVFVNKDGGNIIRLNADNHSCQPFTAIAAVYGADNKLKGLKMKNIGEVNKVSEEFSISYTIEDRVKVFFLSDTDNIRPVRDPK